MKKLCDSVKTAPWGMGYEPLTQKLKGPLYHLSSMIGNANIVETLFSTHLDIPTRELNNLDPIISLQRERT